MGFLKWEVDGRPTMRIEHLKARVLNRSVNLVTFVNLHENLTDAQFHVYEMMIPHAFRNCTNHILLLAIVEILHLMSHRSP